MLLKQLGTALVMIPSSAAAQNVIDGMEPSHHALPKPRQKRVKFLEIGFHTWQRLTSKENALKHIENRFEKVRLAMPEKLKLLAGTTDEWT